ncbi:uncharacterized protein HD556DRAFT_1314881 [Suillus plorans]|uniref:Uncharacterized protein n=1 Tax=Suillus plorans TaxID=116603 RepID=A0A9P7DA54_9AGAM|nr:uncharacterized protein HD556DRAFT_1314881 [Suillus plorans]KAG1784667.1 hypothetical protein HD556DRAFT_1314881 [Suillus plorans]
MEGETSFALDTSQICQDIRKRFRKGREEQGEYSGVGLPAGVLNVCPWIENTLTCYLEQKQHQITDSESTRKAMLLQVISAVLYLTYFRFSASYTLNMWTGASNAQNMRASIARDGSFDCAGRELRLRGMGASNGRELQTDGSFDCAGGSFESRNMGASIARDGSFERMGASIARDRSFEWMEAPNGWNESFEWTGTIMYTITSYM